MNPFLISTADQLISSYKMAWTALYPSEPVPSVITRRTRTGRIKVSIHSRDGIGDFMKLDHFQSRISDMRYWAKQARAV